MLKKRGKLFTPAYFKLPAGLMHLLKKIMHRYFIGSLAEREGA